MGLKDHEDLEISIKGMKLVIRNGIFNPDPKLTNSTAIILNNLQNVKGKDILDVGCGSGIIGIYCILHGARKVVATDTDEKAILNTQENANRNKVEKKMKTFQSDLFENVSGKFDYIFGNLPIVDKAWNLNILTKDLMKNFISASLGYLKKDGCVFVVWLENADILRDYLKEKNYNFEEITEKRLGKVWFLFKIEHGKLQDNRI